ncbi:hypothetical protein ETU09_09685 [Apibacter muscae]|uniref:DUF1080 domain-containing protein n=1 Tax=Apibacter muscae TaxID=2509004 RepID=A0A563D9P7_9FLAO|nr:hypothetical protein [Apibacter muscae]TWP26822.1 hypothetical protein ETU09_09685 [Apibacter muscae]
MSNKIIACLFSILTLFILTSCNKKTKIFEENFSNNSNRWDTLTSVYISNEIKNNQLVMSNQLDNILNSSLIRLDFLKTEEKYSISSILIFDKFYGNHGLGGLILFSDSKDNPKNFVFFGINSQNEIVISEENASSNFSKVYYKQKNQAYKQDETNVFKLKYLDNHWQFLVNNKPIVTIQNQLKNNYYMGFGAINCQLTSNQIIIESE